MQCGKVENEIHFIVECDNYIGNWNKLYDCVEKINAKFKPFSKDDQFLSIMKTEEAKKKWQNTVTKLWKNTIVT